MNCIHNLDGHNGVSSHDYPIATNTAIERGAVVKLSGGKAVNHYTRNRTVVEGHFEFADPDQKFDKAGTYEIPVVFKPDDTLRFNDSVYTYVRTCKNGPFKAAAVTVTVG